MASVGEFAYVETVDNPEMLKYLDFDNGQTEIIVPGLALNYMPFKPERFIEDDEYWAIVDQIKSNGYDSSVAIHVRPAPKGSWLIDLDDAPRFMAAKYVANNFFANLLAQKVRKVRFILHEVSLDGKSKALRTSFGQGA